MTNELRELDDLLVPDDLWDRARSRAPGSVPPRPRGAARVPTVLVAIAASAASLAILVSSFDAGSPRPRLPSPVATPAPPVTFDGWSVTVSAAPLRIGPLRLSVGSVTAADRNGWIQHSLTIQNTSDRAVVLADRRTSTFIGPPGKRLLVSDWGCGYASSGPNAPVHPGACLLYLDQHLLAPGRQLTRNISLMKDLPGMGALTSGTFVFRQPIGYSVKGQPGPVHEAATRITYTITRVPELSFAPAEGWSTQEYVRRPRGNAPSQAWASNQPLPTSMRAPVFPSDENWLDDDGVLIIAWEVTFDPPDPVHHENFADVEGAIPLTEPSVGYEGQSSVDVSRSQMTVTANGRHLQLRVYFGSVHPSDDALAAAQAELARLIVSQPDWVSP